MAELEVALKDLLVYNLAAKRSDPGPEEQGPAFDLSRENYLEVIKVSKDLLSQLPSSWSSSEELKVALSTFLQEASVEKYVYQMLERALFCEIHCHNPVIVEGFHISPQNIKFCKALSSLTM